MTSQTRVRCAVVVGRGDFSGYIAGTTGAEEPRIEFVEIARATQGHCLSYTTAAQKYGKWFSILFAKRSNLGSAVHAALVSGQYDSIYVTGEEIGLPLALMLRMRGWNGRLVCLAHRVTPWRARAFRLIGARIFHRVITVSQAQAAMVVKLSGFPEKCVRALHNWVDDRFFDPELITRIDNIDFVACGAENRDYAVVQEAFAELPQFVIRIFGHGFFGTAITSVDNVRAGPGNVVAMPRVSYRELRDYYGSAKAVIVPLNDVNYAAGVTGALEAMASGCPVIATETDGIAEYMAQIDPRLRLLPGDARSLALAVRAIDESDVILRAVWGRANRQWVITNCSLDKYVAAICDEMNNVKNVDCE